MRPLQRTRHSRFATIALAATLVAGCGADPVTSRRSPDLVLITVDTLRADHLGCYGHFLDVSPNIDRFAAEGVRFEDATAQWPATWPSMASILTGTYPARHGVVWKPKRPLAHYNLTLAETLRAAGYRTGAVVSNPAVGRRMRFDQGFDWFVESWQEDFQRRRPGERLAPARVKEYTDATVVTDQALYWLVTNKGDEPAFLWVHYMEPHGPYVPPERYDSLYRGAYPPNPVPLDRLPRIQRQTAPGTGEPVRDLAFYMERYDREIRYLDDELGRLLAGIKRHSKASPGLVVLSSDHGESLDEHLDYLGHGRLPFQPTVRVPLILRMSGRLPAGRVVHAPVGLVALYATILELLDVPLSEGPQEPSLLPWIERETEVNPRSIFGNAGIRLPAQQFVRRGRFKLVRFGHPKEADRFGEFALYDLESDPGETRSVIGNHPEMAAELRRELERWSAENTGPPRPDTLPVEFEAQERDLLRALGYGY